MSHRAVTSLINPYEALKRELMNVTGAKEDLINLVIDRLQIVNVKKGDYLLKNGEVCRNGFYVNKGAFMHVCTGDNGKQSILGFSTDEDFRFISSLSYMTEQPESFDIIALEPGQVLTLSKDDLMELSAAHPQFAMFYQHIMLQALTNLYTYSALRMTYSPERFLEYLYQNRPVILRRIPDKYIALFIGISKEWLCKIKKKYWNKPI